LKRKRDPSLQLGMTFLRGVWKCGACERQKSKPELQKRLKD
jgi:hypothetical protein